LEVARGFPGRTDAFESRQAQLFGDIIGVKPVLVEQRRGKIKTLRRGERICRGGL